METAEQQDNSNESQHKKTEQEKAELKNLRTNFKKNNIKHKFTQTFIIGSEDVKVINHE